MSEQTTTYADEFEVRLALIHACDAMGSQVAFARFVGVTPAYLSHVMSGKQSPSVKLLASIGYERVMRYRRFGTTILTASGPIAIGDQGAEIAAP